MLKLRTAPLSLMHWALLQARLTADLDAQHARVMAAIDPVVVSVDSKGYQERLVQNQALFQNGVARLEAMRLLALAMSVQLDAARFEANIFTLHARIELFQQLEAFYSVISKDRPSRADAEQQLAQLQAAFVSASKPSGGEWAATERGRLLSMTVALPALAAEDTPNFLQVAQGMRNDLASLRVELDALMATTLVSLQVGEPQAAILGEMGVASSLPEPAGLPESSTAVVLEAPAA